MRKLACERINSGLVRFRGMMWVVCRLRKPNICAASGKPLAKGDAAYRPLTNGYERMKRIDAAMFDG